MMAGVRGYLRDVSFAGGILVRRKFENSGGFGPGRHPAVREREKISGVFRGHAMTAGECDSGCSFGPGCCGKGDAIT